MREARLAIATGELPAAAPTSAARVGTARRRSFARRSGAFLLAATLSLGVVGAALAAGQAGGPLYGTRVWLESLTLPADAAMRADAEIVRLEERLAEIDAAAARGDADALGDALAAYGLIADEALAGALGHPTAVDRIRTALDRHLAVLARVAGHVPSQAAAQVEASIERAIEHSNAAIDRIQGRPRPSTGEPAGSTPDQTPRPETKTPKPDTKTPKPTVAPTPAPAAATPRPVSSHPPAGPPSAKPGKTPPAHPDDPNE
jgi:hypothetical protein